MNQIQPIKISQPLNYQGFSVAMEQHGLGRLHRAPLSEVQINVGKRCNQACEHCHVDAGPNRTEEMNADTAKRIIHWVVENGISRVDITGGAPELNANFRTLVKSFRKHDIEVTSRCNLTVLFEAGQDDLADFYKQHQVRLVCSLPCYTESNVDGQRGRGVFKKSIRALQLLNNKGYGTDAKLTLDLVYNPAGPFLPPPQETLKQDYDKFLGNQFNIRFDQLLTITNLPINRYLHFLKRTGKLHQYEHLLQSNFNPETIPALMCRHLISIDWQGRTYDCDFNQMLDMPLGAARGSYLWELDSEAITGAAIAVGRHCFGCTAGAGSSCGGSLA